MTAGPHAAGRPPPEPAGLPVPVGDAGQPPPGAPGGPVRAARANTGSQRAAPRAHPALESVPGRIAGVTVEQVIAWQVAVAAVLAAAVRRDWTLVAAVLLAAVVLALTAVRRRGRWLYQNVAVRIRFRGRRRVRPADGSVDPRLAALRELAPA